MSTLLATRPVERLADAVLELCASTSLIDGVRLLPCRCGDGDCATCCASGLAVTPEMAIARIQLRICKRV
jgi:hypothetical protein